jgi:phospholipid/cholesterol/gamma-HCH transport system substrate-binding protein
MTDAPLKAKPLLSPGRQVAALLVLALVLAGALVGGIAWQQGVFSGREQVYFIAEDVFGLAPGTTVRMSGFRIGKIQTMELQGDLTVRVTLSIDAEPFGHLRSDARAVVIREQLRPASIDLKPGSAKTPMPPDNPRVAYARRGTLTDIADDFRARVAPILDDVKQLTAVARERKGDIDAIVDNIHTLTQALAETGKHVQALSGEMRTRAAGLGTQSEAAMVEANRSLVRLGGLLGQAEKSLDMVNTKLPTLLGKSEDMMGNLDAVLRDTRTISGAAASTLPTVMRAAPPMVDDGREMLQGLRQSWPLRSMLPAPAPTQLPIDSFSSHDNQVLRQPPPR